MTPEQIKKIIKDYKVNLIPMIQIAKQHGVSRQWIFKTLHKAGIETSKESSWISVSCTECQKEKKVTRAHFRKTKNFFCNQDCYITWIGKGSGIAYGRAFNENRTGGRNARTLVSQYFNLQEDHVVHHDDRDQTNNVLSNLKVFKNQGDHMRLHRGFDPPILWDGSKI